MTQNELPSGPRDDGRDVSERIAARTLSRRGAAYAGEVRRLLDAGLEVMAQCGTSTTPRVADIVAAAGLSNDAFYRHFPSKEALVAALLEDGAERLRSYLAHHMAKENAPEREVRRWVAGILSQADEDIAASTLAVVWNGGGSGAGQAAGRDFVRAALSGLLVGPFTALGSETPDLHARLAAHAALGLLSDHLWQRTQASDDEIDRVTAVWLSAVRPPGRGGRRRRTASREA